MLAKLPKPEAPPIHCKQRPWHPQRLDQIDALGNIRASTHALPELGTQFVSHSYNFGGAMTEMTERGHRYRLPRHGCNVHASGSAAFGQPVKESQQR